MISEDMIMDKYLLNIDIIECIRRGTADIIFESIDAILIFDRKSEMYMISAESLDSAKKAIEFIPKEAELILAHQKFYCDLIERKFNFSCTDKTYHSVWTSKNYMKVNDFGGEIKKLTLDNFEEVKKNYEKFEIIGEDVIRKSVEEGKMLGAFIDDKLCGFIGEHLEGSIGMLEVFEEYRRRGIGSALEAAAINKALDEGRIPFGEVIIDNEKSLNLQQKAGVKTSKEIVYWLE